MTRLINADDLEIVMYEKSFMTDDGRQKWDSGLWIRYKIFEEAVYEVPIVDAVPVVRCKNCKWYKGNYTWNGVKVKVCVRESYEPIRRVDDFCSYGEES